MLKEAAVTAISRRLDAWKNLPKSENVSKQINYAVLTVFFSDDDTMTVTGLKKDKKDFFHFFPVVF